MRAYRIEQNGKVGRGDIIDMSVDDLDAGDVLIRTQFSGINYKDALAGLGGASIIRRYPCNAGIECVGNIEASNDNRFSPGAEVIVHGRGIGVSHDGGLAEYVRVPADWVLPLPEQLSAWEAATLGVAGYSAALAVDRLETLGLAPGRLPVVVSGATGGVGAFAVAMLARRGFAVIALSSKPDAAEYLSRHGAVEIISPADLENKPLSKARWCGGIDAAGGPVLAKILAGTDRNGVVASIGNAAGVELATTVLPFILRGVTLTGINADSDMATRTRIWDRLSTDLKPEGLAEWASTIGLGEVPAVMRRMLAGETTGRTIVDFSEAASK
ncbi:YhdH/YhfP family quinone oxidoreductase [Sedimentitalea sp. XS_ASV28]|uniref:YhdH/YhfP family quinone oxidoreductase n=1 Tax=Sedimentitalea sp. XS_ASV28 TaxID=3241296 RepID=UPI0035110819